MRKDEIENDYEKNTGRVIERRFEELDSRDCPAVLVANHGPFCWGTNPKESAHLAVLLEEVARIAYYTLNLEPCKGPISEALTDKQFLRKHGPKAYYGQE